MSEPRRFDRAGLLAAFDAIGAAARDHGTRLELAAHRGAALMLASDSRFATDDVDIAELGTPWPDRLSAAVREIARRNGWAEDWPNDAVAFHLSPLADSAADGAKRRVPLKRLSGQRQEDGDAPIYPR